MYKKEDFDEMLGCNVGNRYMINMIIYLQAKFDSSESGTLRLENMLATGDSWLNMACIDKLCDLGFIALAKDHEVSSFKLYRNILL